MNNISRSKIYIFLYCHIQIVIYWISRYSRLPSKRFKIRLHIIPEQNRGRGQIAVLSPREIDVAPARREGDRYQDDIVRLHSTPGDRRNKRDSYSCPDKLPIRFGTVALLYDRGLKACHLAIHIGDVSQAFPPLQTDKFLFLHLF